MADAKELLYSNLHDVFSERETGKRWAAIERTYHEDVRFIDPEGEVVGWQALNQRAQKILDDAPSDFVLEEDGLAYIGSDTAAMPWRFGRPCERRAYAHRVPSANFVVGGRVGTEGGDRNREA
jgi:hypothetical protein